MYLRTIAGSLHIQNRIKSVFTKIRTKSTVPVAIKATGNRVFLFQRGRLLSNLLWHIQVAADINTWFLYPRGDKRRCFYAINFENECKQGEGLFRHLNQENIRRNLRTLEK